MNKKALSSEMPREYIRNPRTGNLVLAHSSLGRKIARQLRRDNQPVVHETHTPIRPRRSDTEEEDDVRPRRNGTDEEDDVRPPDRSYTDRLISSPIQYDFEMEQALRQSQEAYQKSLQNALRESEEEAKQRELEKKQEQEELDQMKQEDALSSEREDLDRRAYLDKNLSKLRMKAYYERRKKPEQKIRESSHQTKKDERFDMTAQMKLQREKRARAAEKRLKMNK